MKVTVLSTGVSAGLVERTVSVWLVSSEQPDSPVGVLLIVIMPALCLVLGFWVAAVRPRHVRAGWRKRIDEPALQRGGRGPQRVDKGGCEGCGREGEEGLAAASCLGTMGAGGRCAVMPNKPLLTAWRARECLPPNRSEPLVVC